MDKSTSLTYDMGCWIHISRESWILKILESARLTSYTHIVTYTNINYSILLWKAIFVSKWIICLNMDVRNDTFCRIKLILFSLQKYTSLCTMYRKTHNCVCVESERVYASQTYWNLIQDRTGLLMVAEINQKYPNLHRCYVEL